MPDLQEHCEAGIEQRERNPTRNRIDSLSFENLMIVAFLSEFIGVHLWLEYLLNKESHRYIC